MDRYINEINDNENTMSRVSRNKDKYNNSDLSDLSKIPTNNNVSILMDEAPKEIDINKIKNYIDSINENEQIDKRVSFELPRNTIENPERREVKEFDINSILEQAKESRQLDYELDRDRKFNNTEYDILKNLRINNNEDTLKVKNEPKVEEKEALKEENINEDIFGELMSDHEDTVVIPPIEELDEDKKIMKKELEDMTQDLESIIKPINDLTQELIIEKEKLKKHDIEEREEIKKEIEQGPSISKMEIDKSFYTNSLSFSKTDFEGFEELENNVSKGTFTKIAIVIIILVLLITIFLIVNYVFDLNILYIMK